MVSEKEFNLYENVNIKDKRVVEKDEEFNESSIHDSVEH